MIEMSQYVYISSYDILKALDYFEKNNIEDTILKKHLEECSDEFNNKEYVKLKNNDPIIRFILDMYKSELNLQMIQNSLLWSIVNIKNDKKFELELLYKTVMLEKLEAKIWNCEVENQLILKLLKDNQELYQYIIFTQNIDGYMEDVKCKEQIQQKLTKNLGKK